MTSDPQIKAIEMIMGSVGTRLPNIQRMSLNNPKLKQYSAKILNERKFFWEKNFGIIKAKPLKKGITHKGNVMYSTRYSHLAQSHPVLVQKHSYYPVNPHNLEANDLRFIKFFLETRKHSAIVIQKFYRMKLVQKYIKKSLMIQRIAMAIEIWLPKIQNKIKSFLCQRSIRKILNAMKTNYAILYYQKYNKDYKTKTVNIRIQEDKTDKIYSLMYNRYLDCYFLFLRRNTSIRYGHKYRINFIINGKLILDTNLPIHHRCGTFFNILDFRQLRAKGYVSNVQEQNDFAMNFAEDIKTVNAYEDEDDIPQRRYSCPLDFNQKCIEESDYMKSPKKKPSFSTMINYSYLM